MSNLDVVNAFLKAAAKRDYETAGTFVADDIEYQNMMLPPLHGKAAMQETCEMLLSMCTDSEWVVHREVESGDVVMNERVDRFEMNGTWTDLPVAGVFVLRDGLIRSWRDYFDLPTILNAMPAVPEG
ncbi:MAG: limonene,2-epoxide hydrolase [Frankiales bacterium]|nr:limonene,2-epoxide hydrolase [Frankiales bacterium]